ncbi:30S ribosomal protein S8 [Patescibacteria group bacterium]|nr:30S ribosomal protein S8 [Patescibacteria group bacterium]
MDPIADMLIKIKNAYRAGHESVVIPHSKLKAEILTLLEKHKFVGAVEKRGKKVRKFLDVALLYKNGEPALNNVKRVSKPSRRMYLPHDKLSLVKQGHGIGIISTSKGIMTGSGAKKAGLGGEVMAEIW